MKKKITIECSFDEMVLIERALELYGRIGMLQFNNLTLCNSLQSLIWNKKLSQEFREKADDLKAIFGYPSNGNPGIFNTEEVEDDCRIAIHIYQQLRHERFKDRIATGEQDKQHYTVDEYPADICQIAGMALPHFKVEIKKPEMKGTLVHSELAGWFINYTENNEIKEIPVDIEDIENLKELQMSDLYLSGKYPVRFEIIENRKMSGISKYAKLIYI